LTVYTDAPLEVPHTWPVVADAYGLLAPIYIAKGTEYKVRIEDEAGNLLYAADGIDNPAEPTGGSGGSGDLVITDAQIAHTGDFSWQPTIADRAGWLRSNGKKIGSPTSSTADLKNALYEDLFIFLWNTFPDTLCPVSSGRGTNAMLDWDAAKSIGTLDMRGYGNAGLDVMGDAFPANRIQVQTSMGTTNTATAATVASTVGLCAGMFVRAADVPAGTKIVTVNSTTSITLSAAATATATGVSAKFSMFQDPEAPGSAGGENTHVQLPSEIAPHSHAPAHAIDISDFYTGGLNAVVTATTGSRWAQVAVDSAGSGRPMNLHTPTRLGTWFVKV
jgi:hypothetical protein